MLIDEVLDSGPVSRTERNLKGGVKFDLFHLLTRLLVQMRRDSHNDRLLE